MCFMPDIAQVCVCVCFWCVTNEEITRYVRWQIPSMRPQKFGLDERVTSASNNSSAMWEDNQKNACTVGRVVLKKGLTWQDAKRGIALPLQSTDERKPTLLKTSPSSSPPASSFILLFCLYILSLSTSVYVFCPFP